MVNQRTTIVLSNSSLAYEQFQYPAGEWQVRLNENTIKELKESDAVIVIARIYNANDVICLLLLRDAINGVKPSAEARLVLPYYPYARADRRFKEGDCFGLSVFDKLIRSQHWSSIRTLDAHCDGIPSIDPYAFIGQAIKLRHVATGSNRINVIFPDKGARERYDIKKINQSATNNTTKLDLFSFQCDKNRDPITGKLLGFTVPSTEDLGAHPSIIVDDICDGGGTFIGIADQLRKNNYTQNLSLYVSHGIFSKGTDTLYEYFDAIYTTNSFKADDGATKAHYFNCLPELMK